MAIDLREMIHNLPKFYEFDEQIIISVGAGGEQFIEYGRNSKQVIAIDNDEEALNKLKIALLKAQLMDKYTLVNSDFYKVNRKGENSINRIRQYKDKKDIAIPMSYGFALI